MGLLLHDTFNSQVKFSIVNFCCRWQFALPVLETSPMFYLAHFYSFLPAFTFVLNVIQVVASSFSLGNV